MIFLLSHSLHFFFSLLLIIIVDVGGSKKMLRFAQIERKMNEEENGFVYIKKEKRREEKKSKQPGPISKRKQHHKGRRCTRISCENFKPNVGTFDECVIFICDAWSTGLLCHLLEAGGFTRYENCANIDVGSMERCWIFLDAEALHKSRQQFQQKFRQIQGISRGLSMEFRVIYRTQR